MPKNSAHPNTLTPQQLGGHIPRRGGKISQSLAQRFLAMTGWQITGDIPNIAQAVLLAAPHTSNIDGIFAIATWLALDIDIRILGKKQLFFVPLLGRFLHWAGVMPIDRDKKGSVLQANIDRFKQGNPLFLALAPEGTRAKTQSLKTGFYYLAVGAGVPIIPVAMDYKKRTVAFLPPFYPTGDIDTDMPKIYAYYHGVTPKHPDRLATVLKHPKHPDQ